MGRLAEIEQRLAAIATELNSDTADLDALEAETNALKEERKGLKDKVERRQKLLAGIADGINGITVATFGDGRPEQRNFSADSKEYRRAFLKELAGQELSPEERAAFVHTTTNSGNVLPTTMLNQIWDMVTAKHCIMNDITVYRTGTVIEVVKHTAITAGKAKKVNENTANDPEQNTFVKVTLSGNDFSKHVDISYAMASMSMDALESYLINEISAQIGEALSNDIVTQIKADISSGNKITAASQTVVTYPELVKTFGLLKRTGSVSVYVNNATMYNQLVSMVDSTGRPIFQPNLQAGAMGVLIGGTVKIEESMGDGEILIGDPGRVVYNMVQDIMIETDRDVKNHVITYSGYARGQGSLLDDQSFALLTLAAGA